MTAVVGILILVALFASAALVLPVARRSGLGIVHPAAGWLALEGVFFGIGSIVLAMDGRFGPGLYVSGAVLAFAVGVAASGRLATRRSRGLRESAEQSLTPPTADQGLRMAVVGALAILAVASLGPTLVRIGLPFLAGDITGARSEVVGLPVQLIRVAVPALVIAVAIDAWRRGPGTRMRPLVVGLAAAIVVLELVLASRYLAAELIAAFLIAWRMDGRTIPHRLLVAGALAGIVVFGGVQILRSYQQAEGRELAFAIERTVNRVVMIQPRTLEAFQAVIPAERAPFGGLTWLHRLGPLFGRDDIPNLGYWIYPRLFPDQTIPGYAAPGLLGETWANFGAAGAVLFALFGVAVERLGALVAVRCVAIADLAAGSLAILFVARTHALGLNGLVLLLGLVAIWRLLAGEGAGSLLRDAREVMAWSA